MLYAASGGQGGRRGKPFGVAATNIAEVFFGCNDNDLDIVQGSHNDGRLTHSANHRESKYGHGRMRQVARSRLILLAAV